MTENQNPRRIALDILIQIETGAYTDRALNAALERWTLDLRDARQVTELVNGSIRMQGHLDWVLNRFVKGGVDKQTTRVRNGLRLGTYQVLFQDAVPDAVAVNETVEVIKDVERRGAASFINAVLRRVVDRAFTYPDVASDAVTHISVCHSHPRWLVKRWCNRFGTDETIALCRANNRIPDVTVRVNLLRTAFSEAERYLTDLGVEVLPGLLLEGYFRLDRGGEALRGGLFESGWFVAQDESAGLAVLLLDPQPGERVLDLCSAPGGKTTHAAQLMGDRGRIMAVDISADRLQRVDENCRRLGIECVETLRGDGTVFVAEPFDRILIDAPCSGTGVLARRADARWRKTPGQIRELNDLQARLFEHAVTLLKPGGVIVYSTCSIEEEENEGVLQTVLQRHAELVVDDAAPFVPDTVIQSGGYVQTFPHRHGTDGSFAVRVLKAT